MISTSMMDAFRRLVPGGPWPAGLVLGLALCGCAVGGETASAPAAAAEPPQSLTVAGALAGKLDAGAGTCGILTQPESQQGLNMVIVGTLNGANTTLTFGLRQGEFTGPGTYPAVSSDGHPRVTLISADRIFNSTAGALVVGADGRSGTVDVDLESGERISGTWKCH